MNCYEHTCDANFQLVGQITSLRLIQAYIITGLPVPGFDPLVNGAMVNLSTLSSTKLSIEAVTVGTVGSVQFAINSNPNLHIENLARWAMCGNNGDNFKLCNELVAGTHTLTATPYAGTNATGIVGTATTVTFTIIPKAPPVAAPAAAPVAAPVANPAVVPVAVPVAAPVVAPVAVPVAGKWIQVDPNATIIARHEACFVMVGRKAYLLAGRRREDYAVDIYDPVLRTWSKGMPPPIEVHHSQCVVADDKIWLVSSWAGKTRETNNAEIWIYDPTTNAWSSKAGLPEPRHRGGAASVLVGRRIYVSHGNRGGHETANYSTSYGWLDYYDIDADQWTTNLPDAPNARDHTGGVLINGRICVAGGRDGGSIGFFNLVILPTDCYDPVTNTWTVEANIPQGRAGSSYGRTCDGKLMVAGGEGFGKAWKNVDVFDGKNWTSIAPLNLQRHGSGLAVDCICNQIYIASGSTSQGSAVTETRSVETFFPGGVDARCPA